MAELRTPVYVAGLTPSNVRHQIVLMRSRTCSLYQLLKGFDEGSEIVVLWPCMRYALKLTAVICAGTATELLYYRHITPVKEHAAAICSKQKFNVCPFNDAFSGELVRIKDRTTVARRMRGSRDLSGLLVG
jgi:hypothetical protein